MAFTKINAAGIGTTETVTVDGLTVINDGSFGGNLTVGGVLTYEDVTNVDSVGLITARNGIVVGSGITLSKDGDIFATGITTVSGNVKVGTGITLSPDGDGFYTGVVTATTFKGDGSQLTGVNSDVVDDTSPQLGGNLDVNTKNIVFGDSASSSDDRLQFGASQDLNIFHDGTDSHIRNNEGKLIITNDDSGGDDLHLRGKASEESIICRRDGAVELYHDNVKTFETDANGIKLLGPEGGEAEVNLFADEGDDNADKWRIQALAAGGLNIQNFTSGSWENNLIANGNGSVELYHDNSKKFETQSGGVEITGKLSFANDNHLNGVELGADGDVNLYHDNSDAYFDNNTGDFYIRNDGASTSEKVRIQAKGGEQSIICSPNGAVELYYDNSIRLQTTTNGVTAGTPTLSETAVVGAQAGFFGGAKSEYASATGLIQNQVCILDTATSAAAGTGGALTFAGYIDSDSTTYYATIEGVKENSSTNNYGGNLKFLTRAHNVSNMNLAMVIDSSGRVGIGEDDPGRKLHIKNNSDVGYAINTATVNTALFLENENTGSTKNIGIQFGGAYTDGEGYFAMVGDGGGGGDFRFALRSGGSRTDRMTITNDSTINGDFNDTSDINLKENIVSMPSTIDKVKQLRPVTFDWKESYRPNSVSGFIAQEVKTIYPDLVRGVEWTAEDPGKHYTINTMGVVAHLTKALQEEIAKREALEARIAALEG